MICRRRHCRTCGAELVWERSIQTGWRLRCRLLWEQERERERAR
jgi:hypothetical protein